MSTHIPSAATLRRAIEISEKIEKLEADLRALLAGGSAAAPSSSTSESAAKPAKKRRRMSPEARARIVNAQKARWARVRAEKAAAAKKK
jgi:hypothetical protein